MVKTFCYFYNIDGDGWRRKYAVIIPGMTYFIDWLLVIIYYIKPRQVAGFFVCKDDDG